MKQLTGWLLDLYTGQEGDVVLWLLGEDGQRYQLRQPFPITFYAAGPAPRLRALWRCLVAQFPYDNDHRGSPSAAPPQLTLSRAERRELFNSQPLPVLGIQVQSPVAQPRIFQQIAAAFPDLDYYDADIPLALRYAAAHQAFPLARCTAAVDEHDQVHDLQVHDTPWDLAPPAPPLRILRLEPDSDPAHRSPQGIQIHFSILRQAALARQSCAAAYRLALQPERPLLVNLRAILDRHNPDLILTTWGDTWLLPHLIARSRALGLPLPLNRDPARQASYRPERSYFSYGQVIHRGRQVHLFGRWHIDCANAMLWDDYELEGVLEVARVTNLPVQTAARVSPGTGISAMQVLTALRQGILVPWRKQQPESPKTALQMFAADQGGLVYQPLVGLHRDVAEIDFVSMYPGLMVRFNISPETAGRPFVPQGRRPPAASALQPIPPPSGEGPPGLVPQTLSPLLDKRLALKAQVANLPPWHPDRRLCQARASAHKWLLVTCFGYLGYKNARFGRIEAHEAVTAYGREALLRAKEAAEDLGCTVLHLYVDGLWVQKPGASTVADFQPLLDAILERTRLPIALDGVYRWVAFLSSRLDARLPVPNRYFGVFQDGSLKVRGIEARRRDTPPFIAKTQMQILEMLAQDEAPLPSEQTLRRAISFVRRRLRQLRAGRVSLQELLVSQKLSREPDAYRQPSPSARAAIQLQAAFVCARPLRPGQHVRFLYTRGEPGVHAWDLPHPPDPAALDLAHYACLLLRAASSVLEPFGVSQASLSQLAGKVPARQLSLPVTCWPICPNRKTFPFQDM